MDRSEINRALAKALAYKQCGKEQDAQAWAIHLVRLLGAASILDAGVVARAAAREALR